MVESQALIIYGDGLQALFYDDKNVRDNRQGEKVLPMLVFPSDEINKKYGVTEEHLTVDLDDRSRMGMWVNYPPSQIDWLNRSRGGAVIFVWCSFSGENTKIMQKMEGLFEADKSRDKMENMLRANIIYLTEQLKDFTSNQSEIFKQQQEMVNLVKENIPEDNED